MDTSSINLSSENEWISLTGVPRKQNSNFGMHQLLPASKHVGHGWAENMRIISRHSVEFSLGQHI